MRFRDQIIGNDPVCRQGHPVGAILTASCDGGDITADLAAGASRAGLLASVLLCDWPIQVVLEKPENSGPAC